MRTWKPTIQSIFGLLGGSTRSTQSLQNSIEDIRDDMLATMGEAGAKKFTPLARRIQYAQDLQALWYLRGDLMAALASLHGEARARDIIRALSDQFQGLLPGGLASRPSPLGN